MKRLMLLLLFLLVPTVVMSATLTANYVSKAQSGSVIENSIIYDNGTNIGISSTVPRSKLDVVGTITATSLTASVTGNVTGNLTGNVTGGINWTDMTALGTGSSVSADKFTGDINWTDKNLFQQAYSGINWTDCHYPCFSDVGVMTCSATSTCP